MILESLMNTLQRLDLAQVWPHAVALFGGAAALLASAHVVLCKRDHGAAAAWVGLIWLVPVVGATLYLLLGVNRIERKASRLKRLPPRSKLTPELPILDLDATLEPRCSHLRPLARLVNRVARRRLTSGNAVQPLESGDSAYPAMLDAIATAKHSVTMCSYIFDNDGAGRRFVQELAAAKQRGVEVRVLVDAVGSRYSWPRSIFAPLHQERVPCARFLRTRVPWRMPYANLRNHRKILVVDGSTGFTGGINIRSGNQSTDAQGPAIQDLHFSFEGPVVLHLQQSFAEDWQFTTGESLAGDAWFPEISTAGDVLARGLSDGPDEDFDKLRWAYLGALNCAQRSVRIITPYFLPDPPLIAALASASLRGVDVDILLPQHNNLVLVHWACMAMLSQVLEHGCRVWLTPRPFDHSKLMVVDRCWTFVGSGNWDPRSLQLNFEFNVECYSAALGAQLDLLAQTKIERAAPLTLDRVTGRSLPVTLRDGTTRLLTPFL